MDAHIERLIAQRDYQGAVGALAHAHGKAPGYRGDGIRAWAFGIARHVCAAELKKRTRRRSIWERVFASDQPEQGKTSISDAIRDVDARLTIEKSLGRLSPGLREALLLRYQQGMDATEVAEVLGISHAAARKRISLGLRDLRAQLSTNPEAEGNRRRPFESGLRGEQP
jgi:RNA polymerase sigma factor (sigma-70 family)